MYVLRTSKRAKHLSGFPAAGPSARQNVELGRAAVSERCQAPMFGQFEKDGGETRTLKRREVRRRPTEAKVRSHRASQKPFRSWRRECVARCAKDWPRQSRCVGTNLIFFFF